MGQVILSHLQKTYPASGRSAEFRAVKDLSLTIEPGEFMVLVGPSGCGKSTTLRMIAGLESITSGTITIAGTTVNDVLPKDRGIAMVFQNYALYPHMTVRENISFGLKLAKTPRAEMEQRVNEAAKLLGLETMLDRKPAALSGGQRQRVALGRAIVRRPQVFLFDEPLSNLDAKMRVQMRAEISQLHDRLKATMIYVTHDQVEAMTMGDRICVMKDGEIQQVARPLELYHAPANVYVAGFIGSPPMNLLRGQLTRSGEAIHFTTGAVTIPLRGPLAEVARRAPSPEVVFGIRPEHVVVARAANAVDAELSLPLELAEPMGAETFLHFRPGAGSNAPVLIARVSGDETFVAGVTLGLSLTLAKAHLFDATTGKVLV